MSAPKTYTLLGADGRPYQSASKGQLTAIAAGYRPCATCCPGRYQQWKNGPSAGIRPDLTLHPSPPPGAAASSQWRGSHIRATRRPKAVARPRS